MQLLQDIIGAARDLRADMKLDPKLAVSGTVYARGFAYKVAAAYADAIRQVARVNLEFRHDGAPPAKGAAVRSSHEFDLALEVPLAQTGAHRQRLEKEKEQLEKNIANYRRQLADETATSKKPAKVVEDMRQKLAGYEAQLAKTESALHGLTQ